MGCHQQLRELSRVRGRVWDLGNEALEQAARGNKRAIEFCGHGRACAGGCVDRAQQLSVLGVEGNQPCDHRRDLVLGLPALDLIDERVVVVGQQLRGHLGEVVEVAVEDGARHASAIHDAADRERCEWPTEQQLSRRSQDPLPRLHGRYPFRSLRHIVAKRVILPRDMLSQSEKTATIGLPDGRTLSYLLAGADGGPLVAVLDGPCSRGLGRAVAPTARDLGVRLLIPDRPGAQRSTPQPGRRIADWPADHLALLDALGVERAGILAQSGGTPYGIALAAAAPGRTTGLALLGALAPLSDPAARREASRQLRAGGFLSRRLPFVLRTGLNRAARRLPESAIVQLPEHERPFLDDPWIRDVHLRTSAEILGNPDAMIDEIRLLAEPWDIATPPPDVVPAALWTGELDTTHPPAHAARVAALLGDNPPVTVVPGAATFGLIEVFPAALRHAAGTMPRRRPCPDRSPTPTP